MMTQKNTLLTLVANASFLLLFGLCIAGCKESEHGDHITYHHKPADYKAAVNRLLIIHELMIIDAPLPPPKHFHGDDDDHDHGHSHSDHDDDIVEVGIFQELDDIVRWLPTIAADSDLPKEPWDRINDNIKQLSKLTKTDGQNDEEKRGQYRKNAKQIASVLSKLENEFEEFDKWDEQYPG